MITGQRHVAGQDVAVGQGDEAVVRLGVLIAGEPLRLKPSTDCKVLQLIQ